MLQYEWHEANGLEQALIGIANIFCLDKIQFKIINYNVMSLLRRLTKNCKSKYNFNVNWARFLPFLGYLVN